MSNITHEPGYYKKLMESVMMPSTTTESSSTSPLVLTFEFPLECIINGDQDEVLVEYKATYYHSNPQTYDHPHEEESLELETTGKVTYSHSDKKMLSDKNRSKVLNHMEGKIADVEDYFYSYVLPKHKDIEQGYNDSF